MDSCWLTGLPPCADRACADRACCLIEQGRDDAAQVAAGGLLGLGRAPPGDRGDDRQVLGQRRLRAPGAQGQLELVPDQLPVQPLEQGGRHLLAGDLPDQPVQLVIERGVLQRLPVRDGLARAPAQLPQPLRLRPGDPLGRLGRAQSLQRHPALGDRDRLIHGDGPHPRAAVRDPLGQPVRRQVEQRRAHAGPASPRAARPVPPRPAAAPAPCPRPGSPAAAAHPPAAAPGLRYREAPELPRPPARARRAHRQALARGDPKNFQQNCQQSIGRQPSCRPPSDHRRMPLSGRRASELPRRCPWPTA